MKDQLIIIIIIRSRQISNSNNPTIKTSNISKVANDINRSLGFKNRSILAPSNNKVRFNREAFNNNYLRNSFMFLKVASTLLNKMRGLNNNRNWYLKINKTFWTDSNRKKYLSDHLRLIVQPSLPKFRIKSKFHSNSKKVFLLLKRKYTLVQVRWGKKMRNSNQGFLLRWIIRA